MLSPAAVILSFSGPEVFALVLAGLIPPALILLGLAAVGWIAVELSRWCREAPAPAAGHWSAPLRGRWLRYALTALALAPALPLACLPLSDPSGGAIFVWGAFLLPAGAWFYCLGGVLLTRKVLRGWQTQRDSLGGRLLGLSAFWLPGLLFGGSLLRRLFPGL